MSRTRSTTDAESAADQSGSDPAPLPGPDGLPLLGSTLAVAREPMGIAETFKTYGDVVAYDAYGTQFVGVFDPELVEEVLVSRNDEFHKGEFESSFGEFVAPEGIVFTEGERWRRQRQLLQSSFTPDRIRSYADGMVSETATLADGWTDGETVEIGEAFSTLTLRILTRTLFDVELSDDRGEPVRQASRTLGEIASPTNTAVRSILPSWVPNPTMRRHERAMDELSTLVSELVAERRESSATGDDLLSLLADAEYPDGTRMTPEAVRDQLVTFLFAGHETTATALTYACWLLADDPDARQRLDRELESVRGDRDPTFADLPELTFAEAIAREAMRLYPPVSVLYREPREETTLGGYRIPDDATLQLSSYSIHRDERWWDEPEAFRPERFLDGETDRPEYVYFPFGGGPRHCLGMRFAMAELTLALATLARRVEFERVTESLDLSVGLTLDPGPVELRVQSR